MTGSVISAGGASRRQPVLWAVLAVSLALNLALLGFTLLARGATAAGGAAESFDRVAWYSVFLDNKEAFVGHITSLNATTVAMDHLYYLT
ncbi:MAG TPA: hypothetical protein VG245_10335, partial [Candidatus Dormibacteraeota bacterium]|nr:hypothetical protein [Candidatus Dormibacteraeota bacterium]